jgi:hypothetical protein
MHLCPPSLLHINAVVPEEKQKASQTPLWTIQMLDQLSILLIHPLRHTKNTFLLTSGKLHKIATDKFHKAFALLDDCVSTLRKFEYGTGMIPSCPLFMNNKAKAAKAKAAKAPKRNTGLDAPRMGFTTPVT